ncbi:MAG: DUF4410 domain-containing protein [Deltaproteobacteria bacterium]|jgi:hypothetical protein|nr:DUF4410 domain-containing protein [Deltaproteobacteria bacterium]
MRKLLLIAAVGVLCAVLTGCGASAKYIPVPGAAKVNPVGAFSIGEVTNASKVEYLENGKKVSDAMHDALKLELVKKTAFAMPGDYALNITIDQYKPGNAFARWLSPGADSGETFLAISCSVADREGNELARIRARKSITFGGGFTRGAWEYVFNDVAEELVKTLQEYKR